MSLSFGQEQTFLNQSIKAAVDSIITNGIKEQAFPGAQVLVAHKGKVVFHEAYGSHTYKGEQKVAKTDLYDLASVTKITAPLPALMKLVAAGKLDVDAPLASYYKPWQKRKHKKALTLREILAHQAGLTPYIVFLNEVIRKNGQLKKRFVRRQRHQRYQLQAYDQLYVKTRFKRKVYRMINRSKVSATKQYKYSGLSFLLFPQIITAQTGMPYQDYLQQHIYKPIGAKTLGFLPKTKGFTNAIVPTEQDTLFRHTLTHAWVHDENAALLGGISGNAGLFGTADDLFRIMQLYQDYGQYKGQQILDAKVVQTFTSIQYPANNNRRGLGFDKPLIGNDTLSLDKAYPAPAADASSFGHAGFTGTFVWADPKNQLVFVFLSNRVHPSRTHRKLYDLNIRTRLHQLFYQAYVH